jgi:hypothetical protein
MMSVREVTMRGRLWLVGSVLFLLSCGGSSDGGEKEHSDAGAGAPVPAEKTCTDLCKRIGDCVEILCNEDSMSSRYNGLGGLLATSCVGTCTSTNAENFNDTQWECLFTNSCRDVFGQDACGAGGSYSCE